jgi:hypothetical protein
VSVALPAWRCILAFASKALTNLCAVQVPSAVYCVMSIFSFKNVHDIYKDKNTPNTEQHRLWSILTATILTPAMVCLSGALPCHNVHLRPKRFSGTARMRACTREVDHVDSCWARPNHEAGSRLALR